MAIYCPVKSGPALYLECKECEDRLCDAFAALIVGGRDFNDYELMKRKMDFLLSKQTKVIIVSGGARGADTLAERYAKEKRYPLIVFKAEWNKYGRAAGFARNRKMHEYISHFNKRGVAAFWDGKSKGTAHNFELAEEYHNQIARIPYKN